MPESSPVDTLKLAHAGLFWMLKDSDWPLLCGRKLYSVLAATIAVGVPEIRAASPLEPSLQAVRATVSTRALATFVKLICRPLDRRFGGGQPSQRWERSRNSAGDGVVGKRDRFAAVAGNPAISSHCSTQDRRLCVPASRRVCPYSASELTGILLSRQTVSRQSHVAERRLK